MKQRQAVVQRPAATRLMPPAPTDLSASSPVAPPPPSPAPSFADDSQRAAILGALRQRIALVQGPPGTGKTRTACRLILAAVKQQQQQSGFRQHDRVLACAFSNVAADNLLEGLRGLGVRVVRVGTPTMVRPSLRAATLDAAVSTDPSVKRARDAVDLAAEQLANQRRAADAAGSPRSSGSSSSSAAGEVAAHLAALQAPPPLPPRQPRLQPAQRDAARLPTAADLPSP